MYQLKLKGNRSEVIPYPSPCMHVRGYRGRLYEYPDRQVAAHWHSELEFLLVEAGNAVYRVNGTDYPMAAGDGLFINSNRLHSGASMNGGDFIYAVLQVPPAFFSENPYIATQYLNPLICTESLDSLLLRQGEPWQAAMLERIDQLIRVNLERPEFYELETMRDMYAVLEDLYRHAVPRQILRSTQSAGVAELMQMLDYIQAHFDQRLQLKDIAGAGAMCQSKCCALFKKFLRQSPFTYLQNFRIQKSFLLLSNSQMSVTDVACACGFNGASYFIEVFRRSTGLTPGEFRRRLPDGTFTQEAMNCAILPSPPAAPEA